MEERWRYGGGMVEEWWRYGGGMMEEGWRIGGRPGADPDVAASSSGWSLTLMDVSSVSARLFRLFHERHICCAGLTAAPLPASRRGCSPLGPLLAAPLVLSALQVWTEDHRQAVSLKGCVCGWKQHECLSFCSILRRPPAGGWRLIHLGGWRLLHLMSSPAPTSWTQWSPLI